MPIRKTRQFKKTISVIVKPAPRNSTCAACGGAIHKGDNTTYVKSRIRRYHTATCVPANVGQAPTAAPPQPKNPIEASHAAMLAMENALVMQAKAHGITPEIEKAFDRYQKLKAVALRPGSPNEGRLALRQAIIDAVKMVF